MNQAAFADAVGVSAKSIGSWENEDVFPQRNTLELLASYCDVPVDELVAFLSGKGRLATIPAPMRTWFVEPITARLGRRTLSDLRMLLDEAKPTGPGSLPASGRARR